MHKTQRLYHEDPALLTFEASVLQGREGPGGTWEVVLDRTAFYPTGGGQPHDTGVLGGRAVLDVFEEDDAVVHRLDGPPPREVRGAVDGARRQDHRQQHTGQHILSRALLDLAGAATVGFHLGEERATIDLDRGDLEPEALDRAEERANEVVFQDVPVETAWFAGRAELPPGLRREVDVPGPVRVVSVGTFDHNACCGTHCARSGEVGPVKILRTERKKGGTRVEFVCGRRALADHRARHQALRAAARLLTAGEFEVPERLGALQEELLATRARLARAEADLRGDLVERGAAAPAGPLSLDAGPDRADWLPPAASALADRRQGAVLVYSRAGDVVRVAAALGRGHAGRVLGAALAAAGGRGGGSDRLGQGQVPPEGLPRLLEAWAQAAGAPPEALP